MRPAAGHPIKQANKRGADGARDKHVARGVALITVIWVVTILFALFAVTTGRIAAEIAAVRSEAGRAEAEELARQAFETAVQRLCADETDWDTPEDEWAGEYGATVGRGRWDVTVEDEGSKFNFNSFGPGLLRVLPGINDDLLAAILDWRDVDEEIRQGGVEGGYYATLEPPYQPRNGRFEALEELCLVKGFGDAGKPETLETLETPLASRTEPQEALSVPAALAEVATIYGPLNVHVMDPDAFEALLLARGVGGTSAGYIKNDLLVHRAMQPPPPATLDSFREALGSFTRSDLDRVAEDLTTDGTININTANSKVVQLLGSGLGLSKEVLDRLLEARKTVVFSSVPQIAVALGDEVAYQKVLGYLTVRSRVFVITARGVSGSGESLRFRAVVRRERQDGWGSSEGMGSMGGSGGARSPWVVKVLSWQWLGREE